MGLWGYIDLFGWKAIPFAREDLDSNYIDEDISTHKRTGLHVVDQRWRNGAETVVMATTTATGTIIHRSLYIGGSDMYVYMYAYLGQHSRGGLHFDGWRGGGRRPRGKGGGVQ